MLLSLAPPSYSPTQSLREFFNTMTRFWRRNFQPQKWQAHLPAPVFPLQHQHRSGFSMAPVLWVQIKPGTADSIPGMSAWPSELPVWLQLEFTGHCLPSQASQQVVGCQQGHGVAGSMGGTANVGQDHWKGEEDGVKRVVQEPYSGPFFQGHGLPVRRIKSCLIFLDLPSLLSLSTPLPRG